MDPNVSTPRLGRGLLQQGAAKWWWAPLVSAALWFVIAWLVLRADYTSLATVGVLVGIVFLVSLVAEVGLAAVMTGWVRVLNVLLAIVFAFGAVWSFVRPVDTFFALASVLGLLIFLQGLSYITRGVALRDQSPYWWLDATGGGLLIVLAIWISTSDRVWTLGTRAVFILLWVGLMAIFRGITDIGLAFSLRRVGQEGARALLPDIGDDGARVPLQERRDAADRTRAASQP
jgi:hypothetical protein